MRRTYRAYTATLLGDYLDLIARQADHGDLYAPDRYDASQKFGLSIRATGGGGILYDSLRRHGGTNVVAYCPRNVADILQTDHYEILAAASRQIEVRKVTADR